jgi:hypothetical protein
MCNLCESRFRVQFNTVDSNVSDLYSAKVCFHELYEDIRAPDAEKRHARYTSQGVMRAFSLGIMDVQCGN